MIIEGTRTADNSGNKNYMSEELFSWFVNKSGFVQRAASLHIQLAYRFLGAMERLSLI